jgi:hypothetical protein
MTSSSGPQRVGLERLPADWQEGIASLLRVGFEPHEVLFHDWNGGGFTCDLRGRGLRVELALDRGSHTLALGPIGWRDRYSAATWDRALGLGGVLTLETVAEHADRLVEEAATDDALHRRLEEADRDLLVETFGADFVRWLDGGSLDA